MTKISQFGMVLKLDTPCNCGNCKVFLGIYDTIENIFASRLITALITHTPQCIYPSFVYFFCGFFDHVESKGEITEAMRC